MYDKLHTGVLWLEHLDILDAIRVNSFGTFKPINQWYPKKLAGYFDVGIEKNSENYVKAIELLTQVDLPTDIICNHELRDGYVRLCIVHKERFDLLSHPLNTEQKRAIGRVLAHANAQRCDPQLPPLRGRKK